MLKKIKFIAAVTFCVGFVACGSDDDKKKQSLSKGPVNLSLPTIPDFNKNQIPESYGYNVFSVDGLRNHPEKIDQIVTVKGIVVSKYECPVCAQPAVGCSCDGVTHFQIADKAGAHPEKRLFVAPCLDKLPEGLTVGTSYTATGLLVKQNNNMRDTRGFLSCAPKP